MKRNRKEQNDGIKLILKPKRRRFDLIELIYSFNSLASSCCVRTKSCVRTTGLSLLFSARGSIILLTLAARVLHILASPAPQRYSRTQPTAPSKVFRELPRPERSTAPFALPVSVFSKKESESARLLKSTHTQITGEHRRAGFSRLVLSCNVNPREFY